MIITRLDRIGSGWTLGWIVLASVISAHSYSLSSYSCSRAHGAPAVLFSTALLFITACAGSSKNNRAAHRAARHRRWRGIAAPPLYRLAGAMPRVCVPASQHARWRTREHAVRQRATWFMHGACVHVGAARLLRAARAWRGWLITRQRYAQHRALSARALMK